MKTYHLKKTIFFLTLLGSSHASWAACNQTLSSGANLATAITNAAAGSTICLNSGTYAEANLTGISKTSDVTVQSVSGRTASVAFTVRSSNHLKFQNLTITKLNMDNGSTFNTNISVLNNTFKGQMRLSGSGKTGTNVNILVDGNTFDGINICSGCSTGRLQLWDITGVTLTNNHFGGGGTADGIQWGGYGGTVGPGNVFDGIVQSAAGTTGAHIDAIQLNGGPVDSFGGRVDHGSIVGNYFGNNSIHIMSPDGANAITIRDNVFARGTSDAYYKIQLGTHTGDLFTHNTVIGQGVSIDAKTTNLAGSNNVAKDNIMIGSAFKIIDSARTPKCTNCTFDHNLFSVYGDSISGSGGTNYGNNVTSTNSIIGMPTFVGGASPTTQTGYQLTSSSVGYKQATDGKDMGIGYYGPGTTTTAITTLLAPTNLRAN
jgi:hypothetical protein